MAWEWEKLFPEIKPEWLFPDINGERQVENTEEGTTSIDALINKFDNDWNFLLWIYADQLTELKENLDEKSFSNLSETIEKLLKAQNNNEISILMSELEEKTSDYRNAKDLANRSAIQDQAILSDQYLDEIDFLWMLRPSISDKLESSENMSLEELIEAARSIELTGEINGIESWDNLFIDLRDKVKEEDLEEFDTQVELFKTEEKALYEENIDTSSIWGTLDEQLASIESGDWDQQFEAGTARINIDIRSMLWDLSGAIGITDDELWNLLDVGPFSDKEVAVRTIYKLKLIFQELEENGKNYLSYYYEYVNNSALWLSTKSWEQLLNGTIDMAPGWDSIVETPFHWLAGGILATLWAVTWIVGNVLPTWITLFFLWAPIESAWRRIKDRIAVWIGDKWFAAPIRAGSNGVRTWRQWIWSQARAWLAGTFSAEKWKLKRLWNLARLAGGTTLWVPAKATDLLIGGIWSLVEWAERIHLDAANLLTDRILLVDGLSGWVGDTGLDNATSNEAIEIRSRVKMLVLWKQIFEYEWNTQALDKINSIAERSLFANSESFYIDLHRIVAWDIWDNSFAARLNRFGIDSSNIMLIPNKKEKMVKLYLEYMEKTSWMLWQIYKNVRFKNDRETPNNSKIELPENRAANYTNFVQDMMADIDFSLISDSEEQVRENMLKDFFTEIESWWAGILSADEVKFEIEKITEWFLPNYKVIQEILQKRSTLSAWSDGIRNIEAFRRLVLSWKWFGTSDDLNRVLSDIARTPAAANEPTIRNMEDVRKEWEELRALSLRNNQDFSRMIDINTYSPQLTLIWHLIEMWETTWNVTEIKRQLVHLLNNAKDEVLKVDYTVPEFNFAIDQILAWKKFTDAGNGDFGTGTDLVTMRSDFRDFNTQISDKIETRLLDLLPHQNQEIRIRIIEQILWNNSFWDIQKSQKFKDILAVIESEVRWEMVIIKSQLEDLRNQRASLFSKMTSDQNSGESNNIWELNQEIHRKISALEVSLQNSLGRGTTIWDRIKVIESYPSEIISLTQKISTLEVSIEQYNSKNTSETRTATDVEESSREVTTPKSETITQSWRLTAKAERIVVAAEYMLRANEFSMRDGAATMTDEIKRELDTFRQTWVLNNGRSVADMSIWEMKIGLQNQLWISGIMDLETAQNMYEELQATDENARRIVEGKLKLSPEATIRSWDDLYRYTALWEFATDEGRAAYDIFKNPTSPADAIKGAKLTMDKILRNLR